MVRKKRDYVIERITQVGTWEQCFDEGHFEDLADAQRALRNSALEGDYRIVAICWTGRLDVQQVTKARLVDV